MRTLWIRSLVVLLSLALVCGNAHASLHLGGAHPGPCPEEHAHHTGKSSPQPYQHDGDVGCCCDCLGCTAAAYLPPELGVCAAALPVRVHYDELTVFLSGRSLLPEPDPPRPATLS